MKTWFTTAVACLLSTCIPFSAMASPVEDHKTFREYFLKKFPDVTPEADFANGSYAINLDSRANWEAIEEFPPYGPSIDAGRQMWETPFANGKTYQACFADGPAVGGRFPYWDTGQGQVVTLELAVNQCREAQGEKPLKYGRGPIADLLAFLAYHSRGQIINVVVPEDDPRALAAYEAGKTFYYARMGQLNFACAHCHMANAGKSLRTEILSPAYGHPTHFPVYRSTWGEVGTLHRRFKGCSDQLRAKSFPLQGPEYRNLEYFITAMSNGLPLNGPGSRR